MFFNSSWLVVSTPENISQLGLLFPIFGKIKFMFQTTNQVVTSQIKLSDNYRMSWSPLRGTSMFWNSAFSTDAKSLGCENTLEGRLVMTEGFCCPGSLSVALPRLLSVVKKLGYLALNTSWRKQEAERTLTIVYRETSTQFRKTQQFGTEQI